MKTISAAIILLVALGGSSAQNNNISFFMAGSSDAVYKSQLHTECEKLPHYLLEKIALVSTGACVELHSSMNCNEELPHLPVNPSASKVFLGNFGKRVIAFKPCVPIPGPYQDKRMEIIGREGLLNHLRIEFNEDNCANLPTRAISEGKHLRADICMTFYEELNCEGARIREERPYDVDFNEMPIKSYSVCNKEQFRYVPERPIVHAKVTTAVFTVEDNAMDLATKKELSIEGTEVFRNNGSVPVKQSHKVSKSVDEVLDMERSLSLMSFDTLSTAKDATFRSPNNISTFALDKIKKSFGKAYSRQTADRKFRDVTEKQFSMEQTLEIPSCSSYEVTSVVNFVENYIVDYYIFVEVSGEWGTGRNQRDMTHEELKAKINSINGLSHVIDKVVGGKNVAEARASNRLTLSFGQGIDVTGVGAHVDDCINY